MPFQYSVDYAVSRIYKESETDVYSEVNMCVDIYHIETVSSLFIEIIKKDKSSAQRSNLYMQIWWCAGVKG